MAPPARRSGAPRWLAAAGVLVAVAVVGLLIANAAVGRAAEERAAERLEAIIGTPAEVTVSGWPVGWRLLVGQPVDIDIVAHDVPLPDVDATADRFVLELREVPVDLDRLDGPAPELRAASGRFVAELSEDAVQQQLGLIGRLPLVDIELRSGVARLNVARFPVIDATAEVEDGQVVFRPTAPIGAFAEVELRVRELPFGFRADAVELRPGLLRLEGSATDLRLGEP